MKVQEFSKKYNVPQELVYEASFRMEGDRFNFDPKDMASALRVLVNKRLAVHRKYVERSEKILKSIEKI